MEVLLLANEWLCTNNNRVFVLLMYKYVIIYASSIALAILQFKNHQNENICTEYNVRIDFKDFKC